MHNLAKWVIAATVVAPCGAFGTTNTYNLNFAIGLSTVTGDIVTDGNTGVLAATDIIGGTINDSLGTFTFTSAGVSAFGSGLGLETSGTSLLFDPVGIGTPCGAQCGFTLSSSADYLQILRDPPNGSLQLLLFEQAGGQGFGVAVPYAPVLLGVSAVPLPPSAWLLLSGLGVLGVLDRRRRATLNSAAGVQTPGRPRIAELR